jgi:phosphorylase kinase alpha/beta subunit
MDRPHIRFNGAELVEVPQSWAHAQNDALGYFLWFYLRRAGAGGFAADARVVEMFALYFERIEYWRDPDSGHWEERAKLEASSIGSVVAALRLACAWREGQGEAPWRRLTDDRLESLLRLGEAALQAILPFECREASSERRFDAALLFLIYPLDVVSPEMAQQIFEDVVLNLQGDYGVRRYLGDSYWTADYKQKLDKKFWTGDFSLSLSVRDKLAQPGEEAQWCLFDPILSVIAGRRYARTQAREDRERQVFHFNRALGQLSGADCPVGPLRCPEAYYRERGRYVANDHIPLLWTQANLLAAFAEMEAVNDVTILTDLGDRRP